MVFATYVGVWKRASWRAGERVITPETSRSMYIHSTRTAATLTYCRFSHVRLPSSLSSIDCGGEQGERIRRRRACARERQDKRTSDTPNHPPIIRSRNGDSGLNNSTQPTTPPTTGDPCFLSNPFSSSSSSSSSDLHKLNTRLWVI